MNTDSEFLVTAQCYEKNDKEKQTILMHDTFVARDSQEAQQLFQNRFSNTHEIVQIYSALMINS